MATNRTNYELKLEGAVRAAREVENLTDRLDELQTELTNAQSGSVAFDRITQEIQQTNVQLNKAQAGLQNLNNTRLNGITRSLNTLGSGFQNVTNIATGGASATDLMTRATQALGIESNILNNLIAQFGTITVSSFGTAGTAATRFGNITKLAMASTGIGLLIVAIGSLISYFLKTQEGSDKLGRKMAYLGGIFTGVTNQLAKLGKYLVDSVSNIDKLGGKITGFADSIVSYFKRVAESPKVLFDDVLQFFQQKFTILGTILQNIKNLNFQGVADGVIELYTGIEGATGKVTGAIKGVGKEIADTAAASEKVKILEQNFEKLSNSIEITNSKLERQRETQRKIFDDQALGSEARKKAVAEMERIDAQIAQNNVKRAKAEYNLIKDTNSLSDSGRADLLKEAKALDSIQAAKDTAFNKNLEYRKMTSELNKQDSEVALARSKTELQEVIDTNNKKLESDSVTYAEKMVLLDENAKKQKEILELTLKELQLAGQSKETLTQIESVKQQIKKVDTDTADQQKALTKEYIKQNGEFLAREQKALVERKKLAGEQIKIELDKYDQLKDYTEQELIELESILESAGTRKLNSITGINDDEVRLEKEGYEKLKEAAQGNDLELRVLEQEHLLKLEQLQKDKADKIIAVEKEISTKKKEIRDNDNDAELKAQEKSLAALDESHKRMQSMYETFASGVQLINNMIAESAAAAFSVQINEIDLMLRKSRETLSTLETEVQESESLINDLEDKLLKAKGAEREKYIQQLEQERKKSKQISQEKKAEDNRIKQAEREKIRLEQEKEKVLARQEVVIQSIAIAQYALNAAKAIETGLEASKKGKFGWDNIAILAAMTAGIIASMATIKSAAKKGFYDGGYTSKSISDNQEVGVVHANEYVLPAWMVRQNPILVSQLEQTRTKGQYNTGGMVASNINTPSPVDIALLNEMKAFNTNMIEYSNKPIYTVATEVAAVNTKVTEIVEYSIK